MKKFLKTILFLCAITSLAYAEEATTVATSSSGMSGKKAMNKLDFYERVVRSVAREEAEVAGYYEIMGEEKARPSIMDEQNQAPAETTTEASTQEATEVEAEVK